MVYNGFSMRLLRRLRRRRRHSDAYNGLVGAFLAAYIVACLTKDTSTMAKTGKKVTRRAKPPENETPAQAFVRLAQGRTNKAVKAISLIAQLTGSAYESTDVQKRLYLPPWKHRSSRSRTPLPELQKRPTVSNFHPRGNW